jgi:hypothetical protein
LTEAGALANRSVSEGFESSRQKIWAEFENLIEKVGHGLSIETASDLDVIAFMQGYWVPEHRKNCQTRLGASGEKVVSASALKGVIQQIGKSFSMKGLSDEENPAKQESVKNYCEGYKSWLKLTVCERREPRFSRSRR